MIHLTKWEHSQRSSSVMVEEVAAAALRSSGDKGLPSRICTLSSRCNTRILKGRSQGEVWLAK